MPPRGVEKKIPEEEDKKKVKIVDEEKMMHIVACCDSIWRNPAVPSSVVRRRS
jgi:hypothetical protein